MLETVLLNGAIGFLGAAGGAILTVAVLKERVLGILRRLDANDKKMEHVVYRDMCGSCASQNEARVVSMQKLLDERHQEVVRRLGNLEVAFRECFDNLLAEMRKPKC